MLPMPLRFLLRLAVASRLMLGVAAMAGIIGVQPAPAVADEIGWGAFPALAFSELTTEDGLPHDVITAVAQDSAGLLWIGTQAGLARFDGYRLRVWEADAEQPGSLPDNYVRVMLPLSGGAMLLGTGAAGVVLYDPASNSFRRIISPDGDPGRVLAIAPALDGRGDAAWIAADGGLFRWDASASTLTRLEVPLDDGGAVNPRLFAVHQDKNGDLWLGGVSGLLHRKAGQSRFTRVQADGEAGTVLASEIWAITRDSVGRLWVGSGDSGVIWLDPADGRPRAWPRLTGPDGLAGRRTIRGVTEVPGGDLWIATDGAGLLILDPRTGGVRQERHDPVLATSLNSDRLRAAAVDRAGNIWVPTNQGLERHDPFAARVRIIPSSPLKPLSLTSAEVLSTLFDGPGRVWVGQSDGNIDVLDLPGQQLHRLHLPTPHNGRDVQALLRLPDGTVLAAGRGVAAIDPVTFDIRPSAVPCADGHIIMTMLLDGPDILLGSYDGLMRYSPATGACTTYRHIPGDPASLLNDHVRALLRLPDGRILAGTGGGLSVLGRSGSFRSFQPVPGDPDSLSHGFITGLAADTHGRLWLSTAGGGLVATDVEDLAGTPRFRAMRRRNGLPHDNLDGVAIDAKGRVWFTTPSRVGMLDPITGRVTQMGERDGATLKYYVLRPSMAGPDGSLLLGGLGGLAILDTDGLPARPPMPELHLTGLSINHAEQPASALPAHGQGLHLSALQRTLALEFALLDYRAGSDLRYRHRLVGFDNGWLDSPSRAPGAGYTNLPAGQYELQVQALQTGVEGPVAELVLPVTVEPFWYETLSARIGAAILALLAVGGIVQARTQVLRRQRRQLEQEVAARTRDLVAANARLDVLASTDPLTGLLNRRRFLEMAQAEQARAQRYGRPVTLLLVDLDHFKRVNDTYGHRMGDAVLRTAAGVMTASRRASDLAARFGGEELVLLLPETDLAGAVGLAERLRIALAGAQTRLDGVDVHITASIGVASLRAGESLDNLLHRADQALYSAKRAGRDRVMVAAGQS